MNTNALPILDCHQHFFDAERLHYPIFAHRSRGFEALVGDYSALPRVYLPEDYRRDVGELNIVGTIWVEFISDDPRSEVRWAEDLARATGLPDGMIALVDFLNHELRQTLDLYATMPRVRCVRQHLGWHPTNPLLRYASRPDLLSDAAWRSGIASLRGRHLVCEIEVFASQLADFASVAADYLDIQFVLPLMGWPVDLTSAGHTAWKRGLAAVSACPNVAVKIFGLECIFGIRWTVPQVRPWILDTIDLFSPQRCMFASHMPICKLACSIQHLYSSYLQVIEGYSTLEKRQLLRDTAAAVYGLS